MERLPVPGYIANKIAQDAVVRARTDVIGRGWRSSGALQPVSADGEVGIASTVKHLLYQNAGVRSFLMYWVQGRIIPMGCKQGDGPHFRKGKEFGMPGYVDIPHRGKVWRDQKWKYPGLKPKRFLETAISGAIKDNHGFIKAEIGAIISGQERGQ